MYSASSAWGRFIQVPPQTLLRGSFMLIKVPYDWSRAADSRNSHLRGHSLALWLGINSDCSFIPSSGHHHSIHLPILSCYTIYSGRNSLWLWKSHICSKRQVHWWKWIAALFLCGSIPFEKSLADCIICSFLICPWMCLGHEAHCNPFVLYLLSCNAMRTSPVRCR